jgi:hypothetical protein
MARIVCVHGIGQEFESAPTLLKNWAPALCGGVATAGGTLPEADVAMAFYGDVFRPAGDTKGSTAHIPNYGAGDLQDGLEAELLAAWAGPLEVADDRAPADKGLPGRRTTHMLHALARTPFFGDRGQHIVIWFLKQMRRYLTDAGVRATAQHALRRAISDDTRVVVAHSLGSVVAYDTLRQTPSPGVHALVTLGSPLGTLPLMRSLDPPAAAPLAPWPGAVRRWFNIADSSDIVAIEKRLAAWFGDRVSDTLFYNGARMHDVSRYLTARETGLVVLQALDA